jgi:tyrosyl-tRNA synthetase
VNLLKCTGAVRRCVIVVSSVSSRSVLASDHGDNIAKKEPKPTGSSGQKPKEAKPVRDWTPELQKDYEIILSVGEECVSADELKRLLLAKGRGSESSLGGFNLYDGFEPSGRMHIAQGVFKAMNVNKCTSGGTNATFVFWVADWFALMNDKMGGDLEKIRTVGHYLIEVWKAAGMNVDNVVFKWASEEITNRADKYWPTMLDVARRFNITRIKKCCQIMGRLEGSLTAAQILYPLMQCTDVFFLQADICQLGVDQRKVNMLAREYCDAAKKKNKPIILSHHMLYGLKAGQEKMSKSDPDSAIFMEDTQEDVERKIMNAYCPSDEENANAVSSDEPEDAGKASMHLTGDTLKNPCLDYIEHIIFSAPGASFSVGSVMFSEFAGVRSAFLAGEISENELKRGLIDQLNRLLEPVRDHFTNDERAKGLLASVKEYKKESLEPKGQPVVRRLNLVQANKIPEQSHLVFAPMPTAVTPTLQEAVDVIAQLRMTNGRPCVLYLSDWAAVVCNACMADTKAIGAYYCILLTSLKSLDPTLMESVHVVYQSEAILTDPSNYWIAVINSGRHFMLDDVMGPTMKDSEGVGTVIARLMRVSDVAGVEPLTLCLPSTEAAKVEQSLIERFFPEKLPGLVVPSISLRNGTIVRLQHDRASEALKTENDEFFLLDDPKVCSVFVYLVA